MCHWFLPLKSANTGKWNTRRSQSLWPLFTMCLGLGGCAGPQSALDPAGPSATIIAWLWWGMFSFFTLVLLVVVSLWIYAMRRRSEMSDEKQAKKIHRRWVIGGGIILPLTTVTVLLVVGIPAGQHIRMLPASDHPPVHIEVVGHRWWWEIHYPDAGIVTANQLHLPVNVPIDIDVTTADVIHSFWIPRLGGKIDLVPGRVHRLRLQASSLGTMRGQCAEFCGTGHAQMILSVEVVEPEAFSDWVQQRQQPVTVPPEHAPAATAFTEHCGECHRVNGISEGGGGPDLSDVGDRRLLGAGLPSVQNRSIEHWLATPSPFVSAIEIPDHSQLAPDDRSQIAAWLETLGQ